MSRPEHQCCAEVFGARVQHWQCQRAGVIERSGKWFCRQHDPEAIKARREAGNRAYRERSERDGATLEEGEQVLNKLGVNGYVVVNHRHGVSEPLYRREIAIKFEDALVLAAQLETLKVKP